MRDSNFAERRQATDFHTSVLKDPSPTMEVIKEASPPTTDVAPFSLHQEAGHVYQSFMN
jgi:hypothetical protein